jgi:hypothetical protein
MMCIIPPEELPIVPFVITPEINSPSEELKIKRRNTYPWRYRHSDLDS